MIATNKSGKHALKNLLILITLKNKIQCTSSLHKKVYFFDKERKKCFNKFQLKVTNHLLDAIVTMNYVDVNDSLTKELEWLIAVFPNCHSFRRLQFWNCIFTANYCCLSDDAATS